MTEDQVMHALLECLEDSEVDVTPYDSEGHQYILDYPDGTAFLVSIETYASLDGA